MHGRNIKIKFCALFSFTSVLSFSMLFFFPTLFYLFILSFPFVLFYISTFKGRVLAGKPENGG